MTLIKNHAERWTFESSTRTETGAKCEEWNSKKDKGGPMTRKHADVKELSQCGDDQQSLREVHGMFLSVEGVSGSKVETV